MKYVSVLLAAACLLSTVSAQWLETTIDLDPGSGPTFTCYNTQNNKVYCANWSTDKVVVIDGATNDVLTTVTVGSRPFALCYNPVNNRVYCANYQGNSVTVIDGVTNATATVPAGHRDRERRHPTPGSLLQPIEQQDILRE